MLSGGKYNFSIGNVCSDMESRENKVKLKLIKKRHHSHEQEAGIFGHPCDLDSVRFLAFLRQDYNTLFYVFSTFAVTKLHLMTVG